MKAHTVSFADQVRVRNHAITIGDSPACSAGPPISIDWELADDDTVVLSLSSQEEKQERRYADAIQVRRRRRQKHTFAPQGPPARRINYLDRVQILHEAGFSSREIVEKEQEMKAIRRQREATLLLLLPTRTAKKIQKRVKKLVSGEGSTQQRQRLIANWYENYQDSSPEQSKYKEIKVVQLKEEEEKESSSRTDDDDSVEEESGILKGVEVVEC